MAKYALWIAIGLYGLSLVLPGFVATKFQSIENARVFCQSADSRDCLEKALVPTSAETTKVSTYGYIILLTGWLGILDFERIGVLAWWSNPLFMLSLICAGLKRYRAAMIAAVGAFVWGLQAFLLKATPADEGGVMEWRIDYLGTGCYIWLFSFLVLAGYSASRRIPPKQMST